MKDCVARLQEALDRLPFELRFEVRQGGWLELYDERGEKLFSGSCDDVLSRLQGVDPEADWTTFWTELHVPRAGG